VSIDDLVCQLCIGCSLSLSNNRTKLCVITDIFGTSDFDWYLWYYLQGLGTLFVLYHREYSSHVTVKGV
jgi:hypothetical protein